MRKLLWLILGLGFSLDFASSVAFANMEQQKICDSVTRDPANAPAVADIIAHCPPSGAQLSCDPDGELIAHVVYILPIEELKNGTNGQIGSASFQRWSRCMLRRALELRNGAPANPSFKPGTTTTPVQEATNDEGDEKKHHMTPDKKRRCIDYSGEVPKSYYRTATWTNICEYSIWIEITKSNGYDDGQTTYPRKVPAAQVKEGELVVGEYSEALTIKGEHILSERELFD